MEAFSQVQFKADCLPQEQVAFDWQMQVEEEEESEERPQQVVGIAIFEVEMIVWIVCGERAKGKKEEGSVEWSGVEWSVVVFEGRGGGGRSLDGRAEVRRRWWCSVELIWWRTLRCRWWC